MASVGELVGDRRVSVESVEFCFRGGELRFDDRERVEFVGEIRAIRRCVRRFARKLVVGCVIHTSSVSAANRTS